MEKVIQQEFLQTFGFSSKLVSAKHLLGLETMFYNEFGAELIGSTIKVMTKPVKVKDLHDAVIQRVLLAHHSYKQMQEGLEDEKQRLYVEKQAEKLVNSVKAICGQK